MSETLTFERRRELALAILTKGERLTRRAGAFCGQIVVDPTPMTDAQQDWFTAPGLPPMEARMSDYPDKPTARPGSPETAFEAADSIADIANTREAKALVLIRANGPRGCTADEVADTYEWERYSSRPRLSTMKARGEIVDSGLRRKGASGRNQVVWVLPEFGPPPLKSDQGVLWVEAA